MAKNVKKSGMVKKTSGKATTKKGSTGVVKKTDSGKTVKKVSAKTTAKKMPAKKTATSGKAKRPVVSVVMPAYNAAEFIDDTIHSVLGQTFKDFELIIVDDHSTDKTLEVVGQFGDARIRTIACKRNGGAAKARNRGITAAKGRYICFIDADDLWQPSKLLRQIRFMEEKECAFSFGSYVFADAKGRPNGKVVRVPEEITYKQALKNTTISTITVMFDMKKLSKNDIKMPDVPSEDTATWWKVLKKVDKAYGLNEVMAIYRRSKGTSSSNKYAAAKRTWNLYRKCEGLGIIKSMACFSGYAFNAVRRRI